jgi:hypothetical protein
VRLFGHVVSAYGNLRPHTYSREHEEEDDAENERIHQAAIQGKLRSKRGKRGLDVDDESSDEEDDDLAAKRRKMHKKRKIDSEHLEDLGVSIVHVFTAFHRRVSVNFIQHATPKQRHFTMHIRQIFVMTMLYLFPRLGWPRSMNSLRTMRWMKMMTSSRFKILSMPPALERGCDRSQRLGTTTILFLYAQFPPLPTKS